MMMNKKKKQQNGCLYKSCQNAFALMQPKHQRWQVQQAQFGQHATLQANN